MLKSVHLITHLITAQNLGIEADDHCMTLAPVQFLLFYALLIFSYTTPGVQPLLASG